MGDPWAPQGAKKGPKGCPKRDLQRGPKPGHKKGPFWDPPWRGSGELSLKREHSFHYFEGVALGTHFGTILGPIWDPKSPLFSPRGPKRGTEGVQKGVPKRGRFLIPLFEPKWTPKWGRCREGLSLSCEPYLPLSSSPPLATPKGDPQRPNALVAKRFPEPVEAKPTGKHRCGHSSQMLSNDLH